MTDIVIPSKKSDSNGNIVAGTIREASASDGWIQDTQNALYADDHGSISGAPLNAFAESSSTSSYDVTVDTGEAVVYGAWLARDTTTTVTLPANTNGITVYLGWDWDATETVIIGQDGDFASEDPKIPLYEFNTGSTGVDTSSTDDLRDIGRTNDLSDVTLSTGTEIQRWLATAVSSSTTGTAGDTQGEVFRAPGGTSDLLFLVESGQGKFDLVYNAYLDSGTWKSIVAGHAYRLSFGESNDIVLAVEDASTADDQLSWLNSVKVTKSELQAYGWTLFRDNGEVPQGLLGGPAESLSGYPLPISDIDGSSGSAGQVLETDGTSAQWGSVSEWNRLDTHQDTDDSSDLNFSFDSLPSYEEYRILTRHQGTHDGTYNDLRMRLNNDGSSVYYYDQIVDGTTVENKSNQTRFKDILQTQNNAFNGGEIRIRGDIQGEPYYSGSKGWINVRAEAFGHSSAGGNMLYGEVRDDQPTTDKIKISSLDPMIGKFVLAGRDVT